MPSAPSAGFAGWPATSDEMIEAPAGSDTFMYGCARFLTLNVTSVSARPSVGHERRHHRALGDRRENSRIREARDVQRKCRRCGRHALIPICRQHRLPGGSCERSIDFANVDTFQSRVIGGADLERTNAGEYHFT